MMIPINICHIHVSMKQHSDFLSISTRDSYPSLRKRKKIFPQIFFSFLSLSLVLEHQSKDKQTLTFPTLGPTTEYSEAFSFFQMPVAPGEKRSELLHTNQLQVVMRSLGLQPPSIDDWKSYRSEHTFKHVDNKGEGRITFEDFD